MNIQMKELHSINIRDTYLLIITYLLTYLPTHPHTNYPLHLPNHPPTY